MKYLLLAFTVVTIHSISIAQESAVPGLKSYGKIPSEFITLTAKKIEEAKKNEDQGLEEINKKDKQQFYEMSNFGIDDLLKSGQVCFNDSISTYINQVFEVIKAANPGIPDNIRIYTIKSPVVNAYTTDQGVIFVNTGLIAQLENEAQLAFVLCHELIHYTEGHIREGFVQDIQIENEKNDYQQIRNVDKNLASARFSRKLESEADVMGLGFFLNTDYNPEEIQGVFDVLLYSYLPFDEIPFDSSILEIGDYQLPDKYFLTELNEIEVDENADDSHKTHPNINKRRSKIEHKLKKVELSGKDYLISEKKFLETRTIARYEVLRLQLINLNYSQALYSAFLLQKEFPESDIPKAAIAEILYGSAIFTNSSDRKEVIGYYKKQQGSVQQVYYLLNKLKGKDLTLLAMRYNLKMQVKYPEILVFEKRLKVLARDLVYYHKIKIEDITFDVSEEVEIEDTDSNTVTKYEIKKVASKYDKIKSHKSKSKKSNTKGFNYKWAQDSVFLNCNCEYEMDDLLEYGKEEADKVKYKRAETDDDKLNAQSRKEQKDYRKLVRKKGRSLGIDKIVMIDPYYIVYNEYKNGNPYQLLKSEKQEIQQLTEYENIGKKLDLEIEILTSYKFDTNDVDKYNDFSLLSEWVTERMKLDNRTGLTSSSEEISNLSQKYGTKYFAWTGVINVSIKRPNRWTNFMLYSLSGIGAPYGLYYLLTKEKATQIYFILFNIETGQLVMYEEREMRINDSNGVLSSQYYDIFNQIKK